MSLSHRAMLAESLANPEQFWAAAAAAIDWQQFPKTILDRTDSPFDRWYPDGSLNACFNAIDRHVIAGNGERTALIHDSAVTGIKQQFSF